MTPQEHYEAAEQILKAAVAKRGGPTYSLEGIASSIAEAQVHATLALFKSPDVLDLEALA